ncbi:MAG: phosphate transport system permease protein [Clostridia bacterium]|nr:phosphate transport system permease protein [Clostridia bacterium]
MRRGTGPMTAARRRQLYREYVGKSLTFVCAATLIGITAAIVVFIAMQGLSTFVVNHIDPWRFLFSTAWQPDLPHEEGGPLVGTLAFTIGSVSVSLLAVLIGGPLSVVAAVFMVEIAPAWGQRLLQPAIEILAGIPSVVYGWIGLSVLVPFLRARLHTLGFSLLAGCLVLAIMIIPTVVSLSADSLRALSRDLKEAAYALGSTRWQTISRVLLPAAGPGILTAIVLGLARAFGEALAVQMVIGNTRSIPTSILSPMTTLTSAITMDMGYTIPGTPWNNALWSMSLLLLLITFGFIILIRLIGRRRAYR